MSCGNSPPTPSTTPDCSWTGYNAVSIRPTGSRCRIKTGEGIFRTLYTTVIDEYLYVLHCFTKKTQQTPKSAIDLGKALLKTAREDAARRKGAQS